VTGYRVRIVTDDRDAVRFVRSLGVSCGGMPSRAQIAILDTYRRPEVRARLLRRVADRVVAIDDLHQISRRDVELILRPSIGERSGRATLGGARFVLLRREYWRSHPRTISREVRQVVIALGSGAGRTILGRAAMSLSAALPHARISVVTAEDLKLVGDAGARVRTVGLVPSLAPLLRRADIALTAAGQTLYESLASGTPTLVIGTADNQRRNVAAMRRSGAATVVGWLGDARWNDHLAFRAARLAASVDDRRRLSRRGRALVDGKGAPRVARLIGEL